MSEIAENLRLSSVIRNRLIAVRRRSVMLGGAEAAVAGATALLAGMQLAMGFDWLVTIFDTRVRVALTCSVLLIACAVLVRCLVRGWSGRWCLPSVAHQVDRALPFLEERWSAVTELTANHDPPAIRGSDRMLRQVMLEAESFAHLVSPEGIVSDAGLRRRLRWLGAVTAVLLVAVLIAPRQTTVLLRRFWQPTNPISLTRVTAVTGTRVVPQGEPLTLTARLEGRLRTRADLSFASGSKFSLSADPSSDLFTFQLRETNEPFDYRFRAGDGQTDWHRITPEDRPALEQVRFCIIPPEYSRLPVDQRERLPRYCRALEGSRLEIRFVPNKPLAALHLRGEDDRVEALVASAEGAYAFEKVLHEQITLSPSLIDVHGLTSRAIAPCRIVVYEDKPPSVELVSPEDNVAVAPDETITITFAASDDVGIAEAELVVTYESAAASQPEPGAAQAAVSSKQNGPNENRVIIPIPLGRQRYALRVDGQVNLDLKPLNLRTGQELSYAVRVKDLRSASATSEAGSIPSAAAVPSAACPPVQPSTEPARDETAPDDMAATQPAESAAPVSCRPPNDMTKRILNLPGQCCSATRRIRIDEWAGTYASQAREKKQIAIEKYLERLDRALAQAQDVTDALLAHARSADAWTQTQSDGIATGCRHLDDARQAVTGLTGESAGTPYALIGLQFADIDIAHVTPARQRLIDADVVDRSERPAVLDQAAFHIARARELLADLTREYEAVKKEQERLDEIERLAKMHQLFVEDMQMLLGACKPTLNPRDGRWRLVPDELAEEVLERIAQLLERKKELYDELARILAEDPDLMRRFMAMMRKEGVSLRDQLTVLARNQEQQRTLLDNWAEAENRQQVSRVYWDLLVREQTQLAVLAAQMFEASVTWVPDAADRETGPLAECIEQAGVVASKSRQVLPMLLTHGMIESGMRAIEQQLIPALAALQDRFAQVAETRSEPPALRYLARRMDEVTQLLARQEDWLEKARQARKGAYPAAAAIAQDRLAGETMDFTDKINRTAGCLANAYSREIGNKAYELVEILIERVTVQQADAIEALRRDDLPAARADQKAAVEAFSRAEQTFDDLLSMVEEFVAKQPYTPPSEAPEMPSFERQLADLLAALQEEADACERLGAVIHSNIYVEGDWMAKGQGSGSGRGQGAGSSPNHRIQSAPARLQSAAARARECQGGVNQILANVQREQESRDNSENQQTSATLDALAGGAAPALQDWDVLASKLGNALRQGRDHAPPEQYRLAIEAYFRNVSGRAAVPATVGRSAATGTED